MFIDFASLLVCTYCIYSSRSRDSSLLDYKSSERDYGNNERGRPAHRDDRGRGGYFGNSRNGDVRMGRGAPGRGRNVHMGEYMSRIETSEGLSDEAILLVLNPSAHDRDRSQYTASVGLNTKAKNANWRMSPYIGSPLSNCIISNHFHVEDTRSIPRFIYHYDVKIFCYDHDGDVQESDIAANDPDEAFNAALVNHIRKHNQHWQQTAVNEAIGTTYDGRSQLLSTSLLHGTSTADAGVTEVDSCTITEEVHLPGCARPYRVVLTYVSAIGPFPAAGNVVLLVA